jgi:hypothetical protein
MEALARTMSNPSCARERGISPSSRASLERVAAQVDLVPDRAARLALLVLVASAQERRPHPFDVNQAGRNPACTA